MLAANILQTGTFGSHPDNMEQRRRPVEEPYEVPILDSPAFESWEASTLVYQDEGEFDAPQVLHGHQHVIEDGYVLAMKAQKAFKANQRPQAEINL